MPLSPLLQWKPFLFFNALCGLLFILSYSPVWADSPPNLTADIPWTDSGGSETNGTATYGGVVDIATAFNHARRQEEQQLGLAVGSIANLVLPAQIIWDDMSDDEKMLYLLNDERTARAGIATSILALPFTGIEASMDLIAENYANLLHDTDTNNHAQPSGDYVIDNPFQRIDHDPVIGGVCHEFIAYSENLAYFTAYMSHGTPDVPLALERAVYSWIYTNLAANWVHREMLLLQDETLHDAGKGWGFSNNYGSMQHEGMLGVHRIGSATYAAKLSPEDVNHYGVIIVLAYFDPVSDAEMSAKNCQYNVTVKTEDVNAIVFPQ